MSSWGALWAELMGPKLWERIESEREGTSQEASLGLSGSHTAWSFHEKDSPWGDQAVWVTRRPRERASWGWSRTCPAVAESSITRFLLPDLSSRTHGWLADLFFQLPVYQPCVRERESGEEASSPHFYIIHDGRSQDRGWNPPRVILGPPWHLFLFLVVTAPEWSLPRKLLSVTQSWVWQEFPGEIMGCGTRKEEM